MHSPAAQPNVAAGMPPQKQQVQTKRPAIRIRRRWIAAVLCLALFASVVLYHTNKPLPEGLSIESKAYYTGSVSFLQNLSFERGGERVYEDQIYAAWAEAIRRAEHWIVLDTFMLDGYQDRDAGFPPLSKEITDKLIEQKERYPDLRLIVITDEINTMYGSYPAPAVERLKAAGAEVFFTDLDKLRDSNPLYSGFWRIFVQWFGQSGRGWVPNALADTAPDATLRSYMKLLNVKANHRKVLLTDKTAIVSSANIHDASAYHSNIGFQFEGPILKDVWKSEQAVIRMSGGPEIDLDFTKAGLASNKGIVATADYKFARPDRAQIRLLTEGKIADRVIRSIDEAKAGERIWIGMFYLADRDIVKALLGAAERKADVRLILDPNKNAFGQQKTGLPNIPVAAELTERSDGAVKIRWYKTGEEQYHTKLMLIQKKEEAIVIGGSANFTRRNLDDLNLEADLMIEAENGSKIVGEVEGYFERLWDNRDGVYTVPYEAYDAKLPFVKQTAYAIQKMLGFTTY